MVGSHSTMLECMNFLASLELLSEKDLWRVGFDNPLKLLGKELNASAFDDAPVISFRDGRFTLA